jgi:alanyl-tRNA synthetase
LNVPKTEFLGHTHVHTSSTILNLFVDDVKKTDAKQGDRVKILLNRTAFYAESGGQVGDTGTLTKDNNIIRIDDTQKLDDIFIHIGVVEKGNFSINDSVDAAINLDRRLAIMRNHTATHLLQSALRDVVGQHVQQQGSFVSEDRLRFDFTHHKALTKDILNQIEKKVNAYILDCETVTKEYLSIDEAKETGALAFFAEKYGDTVRVVSVGNISKEFCGGTHLENIGQIGIIKIISESAIAQGIRRIEAKSGVGALEYILEKEKKLDDVAKALKATENELVDKANILSNKLKELEKEVSDLRFETIKGSIDSILNNAETINKSKIVSNCFKDVDMTTLRKISDTIKQKAGSAIITLGAFTDDSASILISVSNDLIEKGIKANELINLLAPMINGNGGGKPQLAQAGSKESGKVEKAIREANKLIKGNISL